MEMQNASMSEASYIHARVCQFSADRFELFAIQICRFYKQNKKGKQVELLQVALIAHSPFCPFIVKTRATNQIHHFLLLQQTTMRRRCFHE